MRGIFVLLTFFMSVFAYAESTHMRCVPYVLTCEQIREKYNETLKEFVQLFKEIFRLIRRVTRRVGRLKTCSTRNQKCERINRQLEKKDEKIDEFKEKIMDLINNPQRNRRFENQITRFINRILTLIDNQKRIERRREEANCGRRCLMQLEEISDLFEMIDEKLDMWLSKVTQFVNSNKFYNDCFENIVRKLFMIFKRAVRIYENIMMKLREWFELPDEGSDEWLNYNKRALKNGELNGIGEALKPMTTRIINDIDYLIMEFEDAYVPKLPESFIEEMIFFEDLMMRDDLSEDILFEIELALDEIHA
ncbi:CLUMA_CG011532, isoform A [Clunio marinus]|uniref:CLUMA_CG011532, isoform A n=1 Tax=Clunio marinus TaxID=568069 RepID=A0A1J1IGJ2_9DIPT|nr:CLUMA_CG011532, isoform A [Clunio marinus]